MRMRPDKAGLPHSAPRRAGSPFWPRLLLILPLLHLLLAQLPTAASLPGQGGADRCACCCAEEGPGMACTPDEADSGCCCGPVDSPVPGGKAPLAYSEKPDSDGCCASGQSSCSRSQLSAGPALAACLPRGLGLTLPTMVGLLRAGEGTLPSDSGEPPPGPPPQA